MTAVGHASAQSPPTLLLPEIMPQEEPAPASEGLPEVPVPIAMSGPPVPSVAAPRPRTPRFGLATRGLGSWTLNGNPYSQYGVGGALLFRVSPRLTTELHVQYHSTLATATGPALQSAIDRSEVPVLLGFRLRLATRSSLLTPYLAVAVGVDRATSTASNATAASSATAWYFAMTYGAGAELRLGGHCALTLDVRGNTLVRLDQPELATAAPPTPAELAASTVPSQGIQLAGGFEVYF